MSWRSWVRCAAMLALSVFGGARALAAQPPPPGANATLDSARAVRGENLDVFLITFGPGNAIFEYFGHNALEIRDRTTGRSYAYNWGMFDFNQPNFLGRFLTGDTRYWMAAFRTGELLATYREENRTTRVQQLGFTPVERAALQDYVQWNGEGDNAYYRYDYYRDNCSTRIRDLLDWALRGQLASDLSQPGQGTTWRAETRRLLAPSLPAYAGIQMALGRNADRELSQWEEGFLPEHLADHLTSIARYAPDGSRLRFVVQDSVIFTSSRAPMLPTPPSWLGLAALLGLTLAGLVAVLADSRLRAARAILVGGVALWYGVAGILGTALLLTVFTKHEPYMGSNTILLVLNPLAFVALVGVPVALWRGHRNNLASGAAIVIAIMSLTAVALQLVPALRQRNGDILAVLVPIQVVLAIAVWRLRRA